MPETCGTELDEFEVLYRKHGPALILAAQAIIGERSHAQDAVHKVFMELIERRALANVSDKVAYIFTCVRNAVLAECRRRSRSTPLYENSAWFQPPERDFAEERSLRRALLLLPEEQRHAVILHVWGELTFAQIGKVLSVSPNTAASRYRYGVAKLRDLLQTKEEAFAELQKG